MREKHRVDKAISGPLGITPACAGKTPTIERVEFPDQDHPRVCGKNLKIRVKMLGQPGSPPRVREKLPFQWFWLV